MCTLGRHRKIIDKCKSECDMALSCLERMNPQIGFGFPALHKSVYDGRPIPADGQQVVDLIKVPQVVAK